MAGMIFKRLAAELDSIIARDPAARSRFEVALTYPCFHAVLSHRLANLCWRHDFKTLGRVVMPRGSCNEFAAYGIATRELPDPTARAIEGLLDQVSGLTARIAVLETELVEAKSHLTLNGLVPGEVETGDHEITPPESG